MDLIVRRRTWVYCMVLSTYYVSFGSYLRLYQKSTRFFFGRLEEVVHSLVKLHFEVSFAIGKNIHSELFICLIKPY